MFTGIVETMGTVREIQELSLGRRLVVDAPGWGEGLALGSSVSVNGVCLTVIAFEDTSLEFDAVDETLRRSTLSEIRPGAPVNLEKPLTLTSTLGGHLVQGHVDGVAAVENVEERGIERWIRLLMPRELMRYVVLKGSIAVDGVSLTVADLDEAGLSVAIIPHTAAATTLGSCGAGDAVNVEVDIIAKHLEKLAAPYLSGRSV
jgi:riboflavin synthase